MVTKKAETKVNTLEKLLAEQQKIQEQIEEAKENAIAEFNEEAKVFLRRASKVYGVDDFTTMQRLSKLVGVTVPSAGTRVSSGNKRTRLSSEQKKEIEALWNDGNNRSKAEIALAVIGPEAKAGTSDYQKVLNHIKKISKPK